MKAEILASISAKHDSALKALSSKYAELQGEMIILGRDWKEDGEKMAKRKKFNDIQASKFLL
jgi:hypothetical protein